jgi:hypothetical protein
MTWLFIVVFFFVECLSKNGRKDRNMYEDYHVFVAGMGEKRGAHMVLMGSTREREHLEDLSVDGRTSLKWIFKK